jgi:hypothetical protein
LGRKKKQPPPEPKGTCSLCVKWGSLNERRKGYTQERFCKTSGRWVHSKDRCDNWTLTHYLYCGDNNGGKGNFYRAVVACAFFQKGRNICRNCEKGKIVRNCITREAKFSMSGKEMIWNAATLLANSNLLSGDKVETLKSLLQGTDVQKVGDYYMEIIEAIPLKLERSIPSESMRVYNALIDGTISLAEAEKMVFTQSVLFVRTK